jgi:uncharacterized membrane protein
MDSTVDIVATAAALSLELMAIVIVLIGGVEALWHVANRLIRGPDCAWSRRTIWLGFASWILLALEFALGADIVRTAVAPSWDDIGKLAAIAAIRTGLSFFLERDIGGMNEDPGPLRKAPDRG